MTRNARSPDLHTPPPFSAECEQGIIGSLLTDKKLIAHTSHKISPECFFVPAHRMIFETLLDCQRKRIPTDLIAFTQEMRARSLLDAVGGAAFITQLFTFVPTGANISYYIDIVVEKYELRQIILSATESVSRALQADAQPRKIKNKLAKILRASNRPSVANVTKETIKEVKAMIHDRQVGAEIGIATGIGAWDDSLRGIFPKRFYVIGARPKIGKSSLIEQAAQNQIKAGRSVLIFQRDMSVTDMFARMACRHAQVVFEEFATGKADERELRKIEYALDELDPSLLHVYSPNDLTAEDVASIVDYEIIEHNIEVFYLDLFQRLRTKERDRVEGLVNAANTLREVIQTTGVPGVILAEMLKQESENKRPHSSQFKFCDGLFSACDVSILLWSKDDPKALIEEETGLVRRQRVTFTIDANRGGSVGDRTLYFDRPLLTFFDKE